MQHIGLKGFMTPREVKARVGYARQEMRDGVLLRTTLGILIMGTGLERQN